VVKLTLQLALQQRPALLALPRPFPCALADAQADADQIAVVFQLASADVEQLDAEAEVAVLVEGVGKLGGKHQSVLISLLAEELADEGVGGGLSLFNRGLALVELLNRGQALLLLAWGRRHHLVGLKQDGIALLEFLDREGSTSSSAVRACELKVSILRQLSMANWAVFCWNF
jgi:hypothetical protein